MSQFSIVIFDIIVSLNSYTGRESLCLWWSYKWTARTGYKFWYNFCTTTSLITQSVCHQKSGSTFR